MTIIWLLVGLGLIVLGADWLVEGASSIARKAGVSEFVIGLTIVGFGTSCPELVVSLTGALEGNADVAVGNVLGSNIFNVLFILGLTALLCPVSMSKENRERDIPETLLVTILFGGFGMSHSLFGISEADGLSRTCGHDGNGVAPGEQAFDDGFLCRAEGFVAVEAAQEIQGLVEIGIFHGKPSLSSLNEWITSIISNALDFINQ